MSSDAWMGGKGDKSRVSDVEKYRDNYDQIFGKKTAHEWLEKLYPDTKIYDPDGWRYDDGVTMDTKISMDDFHKRLNVSTLIGEYLK